MALAYETVAGSSEGNGSFLVPFAAHIHQCSVLESEFCEIFNELIEICWSRGFHPIHVSRETFLVSRERIRENENRTDII